MDDVIDWTASAQSLIASTTASWLLRTMSRISLWISWPVLRVSGISPPQGHISLGSHPLLPHYHSCLVGQATGGPAAAVPAGGMTVLRCRPDVQSAGPCAAHRRPALPGRGACGARLRSRRLGGRD